MLKQLVSHIFRYTDSKIIKEIDIHNLAFVLVHGIRKCHIDKNKTKLRCTLIELFLLVWSYVLRGDIGYS